ncbi:hypothetical protein LTR56_002637 [Elasticomyces elasticus]|nr:hypothetical protein LTR22_021663 [Elasticomyces elasticus]KAK3657123.1 hypothetical protein LTR56_002637 [Elasticomyces elasticus]KAK4905526.1 hypothetical protein LTR49_025201 [Elasticomyces elasticus]KAK5742768.1 hypothetical protein LTS12_024087 [Elasticomyces elasticus]
MATEAIKMPAGVKEFSDLVLKVDSRTWAVHKAIICPQSDFFLKACTGGFQVRLPKWQMTWSTLARRLTTKQEAATSTIDLSDDEEWSVNAMVAFFYTQTYERPTGPPQDAESRGIKHAQVYKLADKYDIVGLKALAAKNFTPFAESGWSEPSFAGYIQEVFGNGPSTSELKRIMFNVIAENAKELYGQSSDRYKKVHTMSHAFPSLPSEYARRSSRRALLRSEAMSAATSAQTSLATIHSYSTPPACKAKMQPVSSAALRTESRISSSSRKRR